MTSSGDFLRSKNSIPITSNCGLKAENSEPWQFSYYAHFLTTILNRVVIGEESTKRVSPQ